MKRLSALTLLLLAGCSGPQEEPTLQGNQTLSPYRATSKPYQINGIWYYPQAHYELDEVGTASYYGGRDIFHGRPTATGETFNKDGLTAAHKTLPLPCVVMVTNLENGKMIKLKVNDRGPFIEGRHLDVSEYAAKELGFYTQGTAKVRITSLPEESLALAENVRAFQKGTMLAKAPAVPTPLQKKIQVAKAPVVPSPSKPSNEVLSSSPWTATAEAASFTQPQKKASSQKKSVSNIYVAVGSFESAAQASQAYRRIKNIYPQHDIRPQQARYQLRFGPLSSVQEADKILNSLMKAGHTQSKILISR